MRPVVMNVTMASKKVLSPDELRAFLQSTECIEFKSADRAGRNAWVAGILQRYQYRRLGKEARGLVRQFLVKTTGRSMPQVTRLIGQYLRTGDVVAKPYRRSRFPALYTKTDIELLAKVDEAHQRLSGPATKRILQREYQVYGAPAFKRLSAISPSHIYNLRKSTTYLRRARVMGKTTPTRAVQIGERRKPRPNGKPGYIRIDTVHQPERDGAKSVYHINAVDEITQWEAVACVPFISEAYLVPVIHQMLEQFPFPLHGFHSGNGSEFVNHTVNQLLEKLRVEFTKSRPGRSNDNALVETKNGSVVRKHIGYGWLPPSHASAINDFYRDWFNPYLNFHRPCGFATQKTDGQGRPRKIYNVYQTPLERFQSLSAGTRKLRPGLTLEALNRIAMSDSDTGWATKMQAAKLRLLDSFHQRGLPRPTLVDPTLARPGQRRRP
ncbi:MAG: transposase family protein [Acidimicrobiia bacterium]|nr:transposase family protein [Acidimicrobiia bacterium]